MAFLQAKLPSHWMLSLYMKTYLKIVNFKTLMNELGKIFSMSWQGLTSQQQGYVLQKVDRSHVSSDVDRIELRMIQNAI
jgi:hypothetical protein